MVPHLPPTRLLLHTTLHNMEYLEVLNLRRDLVSPMMMPFPHTTKDTQEVLGLHKILDRLHHRADMSKEEEMMKTEAREGSKEITRLQKSAVLTREAMMTRASNLSQAGLAPEIISSIVI
jgi:hypothetical protein